MGVDFGDEQVGRVGEDVTIAMAVVGASEGDDRSRELVEARL